MIQFVKTTGIGMLLALACLHGMNGYAQETNEDDLMSLLEASSPDAPTSQSVIAAFKATRIVQQHSTKLVSPHHLNFLVSHRFGVLLGGLNTFFGLDNSATRIAFEYGLNRWINIGIGRSTYEKIYDGFVKIRLLSQQSGKGQSPLTITYLSEIAIHGMPWPEDGYNYQFIHRFFYTHQLLIARKFSSRLSLQMMPTYVHRNLSPALSETNDAVYWGLGGRFKISDAISINFEYSPHIIGSFNENANPFGIGIDIETGGHVFQLTFSNGRGLTNKHIFFNTVDDVLTGRIHFGFNMFRTFSLASRKEEAPAW